ncbi:MAG: hypothetical protein CMO55_20380 [Verrucomicrobiales bacterium]|nr:hypothetical protein [Verrucomicrobiales bacterium]
MGLFDFLKPRLKPTLSPQVQGEMDKILVAAFPRGKKQIQEETGQLHALLRGKLSKSEAERLLRRTKALLIIAKDKSEERMITSIVEATNGKLTRHEGTLAYQFFTGICGEVYGGGRGDSQEEAIVINATSSIAGIDAEYKWVEANLGRPNADWNIESRMTTQSDDGRWFETFLIEMKDGTKKSVVFDITSFFGRT